MGSLDEVMRQWDNLDVDKPERHKPGANPTRLTGTPRADPTDPEYPVDALKALRMRGKVVGKVGRPRKPESQLARVKEQERKKLQRLLRPLTGHDPIIPMTFDKPSHR